MPSDKYKRTVNMDSSRSEVNQKIHRECRHSYDVTLVNQVAVLQEAVREAEAKVLSAYKMHDNNKQHEMELDGDKQVHRAELAEIQGELDNLRKQNADIASLLRNKLHQIEEEKEKIQADKLLQAEEKVKLEAAIEQAAEQFQSPRRSSRKSFGMNLENLESVEGLSEEKLQQRVTQLMRQVETLKEKQQQRIQERQAAWTEVRGARHELLHEHAFRMKMRVVLADAASVGVASEVAQTPVVAGGKGALHRLVMSHKATLGEAEAASGRRRLSMASVASSSAMAAWPTGLPRPCSRNIARAVSAAVDGTFKSAIEEPALTAKVRAAGAAAIAAAGAAVVASVGSEGVSFPRVLAGVGEGAQRTQGRTGSAFVCGSEALRQTLVAPWDQSSVESKERRKNRKHGTAVPVGLDLMAPVRRSRLRQRPDKGGRDEDSGGKGVAEHNRRVKPKHQGRQQPRTIRKALNDLQAVVGRLPLLLPDELLLLLSDTCITTSATHARGIAGLLPQFMDAYFVKQKQELHAGHLTPANVAALFHWGLDRHLSSHEMELLFLNLGLESEGEVSVVDLDFALRRARRWGKRSKDREGGGEIGSDPPSVSSAWQALNKGVSRKLKGDGRDKEEASTTTGRSGTGDGGVGDEWAALLLGRKGTTKGRTTRGLQHR